MSAEQFAITPIGYARSEYEAPEHTPVQAALNAEASARLDIDDEYVDALADLEGFTHIWLLLWFGGPAGTPPPPFELRPVPYVLRNTGQRVGLFTSRAPRRPNPIGLSLVRIERVEPPSVFVRGVDFVDGTPILDIKPYVTTADTPVGEVRCGWLDAIDVAPGTTPANAGDPPK